MRTDLAGVLVVSVEQAVAAPYASCKLADAGARVIKVERADGDFARRYDQAVEGQSAYFVWLNRGKESIALNLADERDRALLERLAATADVFIQNLKPGTMQRHGLGAARLRAENPRLITCDITGFGESGPLSHLKAYDLIVQAEAGLCAITGSGTEPARAGISVCDIAAGAAAHSAILEALLGRHATGQGKQIQVSLFDSLAEWMNVPLLQWSYSGKAPARCGVAHPSIAPYGMFRTIDDVVLIVSVQNEREWVRFCERVMQQPDLAATPRFATNPLRVKHRNDVDGLVKHVFAGLASGEAIARLEAADIAYGRLNDIAAAAHHPHLRRLTVETPAGEVQVIAPAAIHGAATMVPGPVPRIDEHGGKIRDELGGL